MQEIEQEANVNSTNSNIIEEMLYDTPESAPTLAKQLTSSTLNPNLQRKRNHSSDTLANAVSHMANTIGKAYLSDPIKVSAEEIFAEISNIQGLEESELLQAYDVLTSDAKKYESFKALCVPLRKSWILMQIKSG